MTERKERLETLRARLAKSQDQQGYAERVKAIKDEIARLEAETE